MLWSITYQRFSHRCLTELTFDPDEHGAVGAVPAPVQEAGDVTAIHVAVVVGHVVDHQRRVVNGNIARRHRRPRRQRHALIGRQVQRGVATVPCDLGQRPRPHATDQAQLRTSDDRVGASHGPHTWHGCSNRPHTHRQTWTSHVARLHQQTTHTQTDMDLTRGTAVSTDHTDRQTVLVSDHGKYSLATVRAVILQLIVKKF